MLKRETALCCAAITLLGVFAAGCEARPEMLPSRPRKLTYVLVGEVTLLGASKTRRGKIVGWTTEIKLLKILDGHLDKDKPVVLHTISPTPFKKGSVVIVRGEFLAMGEGGHYYEMRGARIELAKEDATD